MGGRRAAAVAALLALALAPCAGAQAGPEPLGPFELREELLLAQRRLSLPARGPATLARGASSLRLDLDWGSDFAVEPNRYLLDGEHRSFALTLEHGVRDRLTLGLRVPIEWRGGGELDGPIDWFHRVTGLPNGGRPRYSQDRLIVRALDPDGVPVEWQGGAGTGLGRVELSALFALARGEPRRRRLSLAARVALPTGGGAFPADAVSTAAGAQLLASTALGERFDLYAGAGAAADGCVLEGLDYERVRGFAFVALEWRPFRRYAFLAQSDWGSRLSSGIWDYPGAQSYLRLGLKRRLGERWVLDLGFSEGLVSQQSTTDFGVFAGVSLSLGGAASHPPDPPLAPPK
ncbi:MAG: DUF3187 family protein [Vicinamibacteria bacterium]